MAEASERDFTTQKGMVIVDPVVMRSNPYNYNYLIEKWLKIQYLMFNH